MHNLAQHRDVDGHLRSSCYSLNESPWHRQGVVVNTPMGDPDLLRAAGLDWRTDLQPMWTNAAELVPDHRAVTRSDDGRVLGVVGKTFTPLHNHEMLDFLRKANGLDKMIVETAGALGQGETTWILAQAEELNLALGDDLTLGYLLIVNGHAGNAKLTVTPTGVRCVCQNTISLALQQRRGKRNTLAGGHSVRHTSGMAAALDDIAASYAAAIAAHQKTKAAAEFLATRSFDGVDVRQLLDRVFEPAIGPDETDRAKAIRQNRERKIEEILASPTSRVPGTAGTYWSLANAVVEWVDFHRPTRAGRGQDEAAQRFRSAAFGGSGQAIKAKTWQAALELAA